MKFQQNTIFLSYSQDAVNRLPNAIAQTLNNIGYKVFINTAHFTRFEEPPERVKNEIKSCTHFLLLVTPASLRYGFDEKRLSTELQIAKESNKYIVILLAYDKTQEGGWERYMDRHLPKNPNFCAISIDSFAQSIQQLTRHFQEKFTIENDSPKFTACTHKELNAEFVLDKAMTERYESELYNRKSTFEEIINQAIQVDPNFADAYYQRAEWNRWSAESASEKQSVIDDYSTAIKLDSTKARYYSDRGDIYCRLQRHDEAILDYSMSIKLAPHSATFYYWRTRIRRHLNQLELALVDCSKAIELSPNDERLWRTRSSIYLRQKNYKMARNDTNQVIEIKNDWRDYVFRGLLNNKLFMIEKAQNDWETAIELADKIDSVYMFGARLYHHNGNPEKALQMLKELIEKQPENINATKLRDIFRENGV